MNYSVYVISLIWSTPENAPTYRTVIDDTQKKSKALDDEYQK